MRAAMSQARLARRCQDASRSRPFATSLTSTAARARSEGGRVCKVVARRQEDGGLARSPRPLLHAKVVVACLAGDALDERAAPAASVGDVDHVTRVRNQNRLPWGGTSPAPEPQ